MKQEFYVGQKVNIKELKDIPDRNAFPTLQRDMEKHCGQTGTITFVTKEFGGDTMIYSINNKWVWKQDWLEAVDLLDEINFDI